MNNTSFRDNSGFVFKHNGEIYRQINTVYKDEYDKFISCGLYEELIKKEMLIPHKEVSLPDINNEKLYKCIKPEQIDYISYPYEWCFSELKEAALLTLNIQKTALKYNMSLKDASAFNIQFKEGKPIFIDTLSFETYKENQPWIAYGQFCRHFLAPLALMSYKDISLNKLLITNIDGIPIELCCKLLPLRAKLKPTIFFHIVLHAISIKKNEIKGHKTNMNRGWGRFFAQNRLKNTCLENIDNESPCQEKLNPKFSKLAMTGLIDSLEDCIKDLKLPELKTEWGDYYTNTNYSKDAFTQKGDIITEFIKKLQPETVCDLGANRGDFSRTVINACPQTRCLSFDIDPAAVEENYKLVKQNREARILPLTLDLTNPTPAIGFANKERCSFTERFTCDTVLALALIHHLAISNNLPFSNIAKYFSTIGKNLIIEFVPKDDSKVQILLSTREDIFQNYTEECFENEFSNYYTIIEKRAITGSKRTIYLMERR